MLSQKARYALHALIVLAEHTGEEPMQIAAIADEARVPRKFLEQILLDMKKRGIVKSTRGRSGGYLIGKAPKDISFADVIRTIDGPLALAPCVSPRLGFRKCDDCPDLHACSLREALLRARDATADVLEAYSLADAAASGADAADQLAAI